MRGIIDAVPATATAAAWAGSPFAQATVKTRYKNGKPFVYRGPSVAPLSCLLCK